MADETLFEALTDVQVLAGTMWAEASGDRREGNSSVEERIAVGCVVRNRLAKYRSYIAKEPTYKAVCLAHANKKGRPVVWQFDCWRPGPANYERLLTQLRLVAAEQPPSETFLETLYLARGVMDRVILDRTNGADFYYAPKSMVPVNAVPLWARDRDPVATIGDQRFFRLA
jgi:hypothetical protein